MPMGRVLRRRNTGQGRLLVASQLAKVGSEAHNTQRLSASDHRSVIGQFINLNGGADMKRNNRWLTVSLLGFVSWALADFAVPVHGQAIGFQPIPAPLPSGVMLDVTPSVSADRRYVRLGVNVGFNDLLGFTSYSVPAAVGGGGAVGAAGMNGLIGGFGGGGGGAAGGRGVGGAGGLRSEGLAGPVTDADVPMLGFRPPAGDPFQQALDVPPANLQPTPSISARLDKPSSRSREAKARLERSPRRDTARTVKPSRTRKRYAPSGTAGPDDLMRENPANLFRFEP